MLGTEGMEELLEEMKFAKVVHDRLIVHDGSPKLENAEERDSNI